MSGIHFEQITHYRVEITSWSHSVVWRLDRIELFRNFTIQISCCDTCHANFLLPTSTSSSLATYSNYLIILRYEHNQFAVKISWNYWNCEKALISRYFNSIIDDKNGEFITRVKQITHLLVGKNENRTLFYLMRHKSVFWQVTCFQLVC